MEETGEVRPLLTMIPRYLVVSWAGQNWEVEGARHEGFIARPICQVEEDLGDDAAYRGEKKKRKEKITMRHYCRIDQLHNPWG